MNAHSDRFPPATLSRDGAGVLGADDPLPDMPEPKPRSPRGSEKQGPRLGRWFVLIVVVLIAAFAAGMLPRLHKRAQVAADTIELGTPTVNVAVPAPAEGSGALVLSGELKPVAEASLHARASGYVKRWNVDLGAKVEAGQVLAELET